jgi:hypothetical protein
LTRLSHVARGAPSRILGSRYLVLLAGFALIAVGAVCLYLSDAVAAPQSWGQGTLDAFGVGLVVGGVVDVLAISALNQRAAAEDRMRREYNRRAEEIIRTWSRGDPRPPLDKTRALLEEGGDLVDAALRGRLWEICYSDPLPPGDFELPT